MAIYLGLPLLPASCSLPFPILITLSRNEQLLDRDLFGLAPRRDCRVSRPYTDYPRIYSSLWFWSSPFDGRLLAATLLSGARTFLPCVNKIDTKATTRPTLLNYKRPPRFMALLTSLSASLFFALSICLISTFLNPDIR